MDYHLLGKTGLRISPLALGTMTFGNEWGWGSSEETAKSIFNTYVDAGGNFIDTADLYTGGTSEELIGKFVAERSLRDSVVLATKYSFNGAAGNPNAGGNGRKNLHRALEGSLRRLKTDYVDLYWVHAWDGITPGEEVIGTLDTIVRSGKARYIGLSDCPAWYVSRAETIAELRGLERIAGMQLEYSLIERAIEHELVPLARELGIGICAWSPLASGFLSGRYSRESSAEGRLQTMKGSGNPIFDRITARDENWRILEALLEVSRELGRQPAEVALNWVATRPGVSATIIGATKIEQLKSNLSVLDFELPAESRSALEKASEPPVPALYLFFTDAMQKMQTGGAKVLREPPWFRGRAG